jgi:ribosome-binding protein aMBF1 (putative translation factor)
MESTTHITEASDASSMTHVCRDCKRTFGTELELELHKDTCDAAALLVCQECGEKVSERKATRDGWHYRCPNDDCSGSGLGEDLFRADDFSVTPASSTR